MRTYTIRMIVWMIVAAMLITVHPARSAATDQVPAEHRFDSYIIKWREQAPDLFYQESEVLRAYQDGAIIVARPLPNITAASWTKRWSSDIRVEYVQENQSVSILNVESPNDPLYSKQYHLQQIQVEAAWAESSESLSFPIAIIDTGIDAEHPDLASNLVAGVNLIQSGRAPADDNGHGTNVAGVIAAAGNNRQGIAGVLWRAKLMPIKAIEANGRGEEDKLGQGIRYAVDNGAKIVVLSLGLNRYSPYMREITEYAERKGVLLVAASGNEGTDVKFPAAYPTVLAVGGVHLDNTVHPRSNRGPELDITAPWYVYTTARGGGYEYNEGTSMAAPQAAGVAALLWNKYPHLKPVDIRNLLRQTAEPTGAEGSDGWNPLTGFGLLRADRVLTETLSEDPNEPNDTKTAAKAMSIANTTIGSITHAGDHDWFYVDAPYDGTLNVEAEWTGAIGNTIRASNLELLHDKQDGTSASFSLHPLEPLQLPISKGRSHIRLRIADAQGPFPLLYSLTSSFAIAPDPFEENDRRFQAFLLPDANGTYIGNFHKKSDIDWYAVQIDQSGIFQAKVTASTPRIDAELLFEPQKAEKETLVDQTGEGGDELLPPIQVTPGRYYIRIRNVISGSPYAVMGEYRLTTTFTPKYLDPNEPNNRSYQSVSMMPETEYVGVFHTDQDEDWFSFYVDDLSVTELRLSGVPDGRAVTMELYTSNFREMQQIRTAPNGTILWQAPLQPGLHFVKLKADRAFDHSMYRLMLRIRPIVNGYVDLEQHWAKPSVLELTKRGIVNGIASYVFAPDASLTRAEAATMIVRAYRLTGTPGHPFWDVGSDHWAGEFIGRAYQSGIISGYPNGTFAPDAPVTRQEMAVMLANALKIRGNVTQSGSPFSDVTEPWALPIVRQMAQEGWITGYADGTFKPARSATRAEFATLLLRTLLRERS